MLRASGWPFLCVRTHTCHFASASVPLHCVGSYMSNSTILLGAPGSSQLDSSTETQWKAWCRQPRPYGVCIHAGEHTAAHGFWRDMNVSSVQCQCPLSGMCTAWMWWLGCSAATAWHRSIEVSHSLLVLLFAEAATAMCPASGSVLKNHNWWWSDSPGSAPILHAFLRVALAVVGSTWCVLAVMNTTVFACVVGSTGCVLAVMNSTVLTCDFCAETVRLMPSYLC